MNRLIIIADDKIPFLRGVLDRYADIYYLPGSKITSLDVKCADAIFTRTRTACNANLLADSKVKLIATATIGFDHIDTEYCDSKDIHWVNAPGCNSGSVLQYVITAILNFANDHNWKLEEKTIGVIGVGNVGNKIAEAARALGMNVLLNDPPREKIEGSEGFTSLDALLEQSDIVTCHTPLSKDGEHPTFHLADNKFFKKMKKDALFINTSRGEVVDSKSLKKAIDNLSGFILDVWENEPVIDLDLLKEAYIATPHIAGYSTDGKANGTAACVRALVSFFKTEFLSEEWYPEELPHSEKFEQTINIKTRAKRMQQIASSLMEPIYPIHDDSKALKESPLLFEQLRGNYWIRREPSYFIPLIEDVMREKTLRRSEQMSRIINLQKALGFKRFLINGEKEWKI